MNKLETLAFIKHAHDGQFYGEAPYWTHPVEVAEELGTTSEDEYLAALLHDVIEDTDYTAEDLVGMGWNASVVDMVELLTKDTSLDYQGNIQKIIDSGNRGAMRVKLADNRVNNRGDKSAMSAERRERLNKKYAMSIKMLEKALGV